MQASEIIEELKRYKVVQCQLVHERVVMHPESDMPVVVETATERYFERLKLCPGRSHRLGCAHTSANSGFNNLLDNLQLEDEQLQQLRQELDSTILEIYKLDHIKGDLEKKIAENRIAGVPNDSIEQEINTCVSEHSKLLEKVDVIRGKILSHLQKLV